MVLRGGCITVWDDIVGNKGQKYSLSYDMDAIESGAR